MREISLIFRIQRFIRFLLKGVGRLENEQFLFRLHQEHTDFEIYSILADAGWTPNYMGYIYKHQLYQARKLLDRGEHQYHVRFYGRQEHNKVTGHFEVTPEWSEKAHLGGVDLRTMNKEESTELRRLIFYGGLIVIVQLLMLPVATLT